MISNRGIENKGMTTVKKVLIGICIVLSVLCIIALILYIVMPYVMPCYYPKLDWQHSCYPVNPQQDSPTCAVLEQLSDDGTRCEKRNVLTRIICADNQILSNGGCTDNIHDTTTNPINPNPNLPSSTSADPINVADVINPPPLEPDINVPSLIEPEIHVVSIDRKDFATTIGSMYSTLQYYIKGDQVYEVTIIPRKNPAYKGICKSVVSHSSFIDPKDPPSIIPVTLNAIGRTPTTAPLASVDDLRPMSYYVWGDGKHMFSVIDKNSTLNYRMDTVIKFPYKA